MESYARLSLKCPINLQLTLLSGQSFLWKKRDISNEYIGTIGRYVFQLKQQQEEEDHEEYYLQFKCLNEKESEEMRQCLRAYFKTGLNPREIYEEVANRDPEIYFKTVYKYYDGMYVLEQHPAECLMSFIISSNNNVKRIMQIIGKMSEKYGEKLLETEEETVYGFPSLQSLSQASLQDLKDCGLGYRAKYIKETAQMLVDDHDDPDEYLMSLRKEEDLEVCLGQLCQLKGVGRKVAACVSLYSMDKNCVPVDVHILRVAKLIYPDHMKEVNLEQSMTNQRMKKIMEVFEEIFPEHSGYAQMILYASQLSDNKKLIPEDIRQQMKDKYGLGQEQKKRKRKKKNKDEPKKKRRKLKRR